jgi:gluconate 5-dehydrogenase
MSGRLEGKVALVTGSGRGFGRAIAIAFASEGACIVSVARSQDELEDAGKAMSRYGSEILTVSADLSTDEGIHEVYQKTLDTHGGLDILVNNAATSPWLTIGEMTVDSWDKTIAVNLRAPFILSKKFYPSMKQRSGGSIINISSRSAELGFVAELAYCSSKFGLEGLTQCLALELKPHNIAVNSLNVASPPSKRLKPTELTIKEAENMPVEVKQGYADDASLVEHFRDAWVFLALQDASGISGMRLSTSELATVLKQDGADEAYKRWKNRMVEAVYEPIVWPKKVRYQTREGGWKELIF